MTEDLLTFAEEEIPGVAVDTTVPASWKLLVIDDETEVHAVTRLALEEIRYQGRGLQFLHAHNKAQALALLSEHADIAIALVDVVMEEEHTGLEIVRYIREQRQDAFMRIILRTGQPGQAPERQVLREYDINDYKEKAELTSQKLFTSIYTALGNYSVLTGLEENRRGLEKVIDASADLLNRKSMQQFVQGVLEQVTALLCLDNESVLVHKLGISAVNHHEQQVILAATGEDRHLVGQDPRQVLPEEVNADIQKVLRTREAVFAGDRFLGYFDSGNQEQTVVLVCSSETLKRPDRQLLELFTRNVSIGLQHLQMREEVELTQKEFICMLGDAAETRSRETANHARRVAEYSRELARRYGLDEKQVRILYAAAPLHDVGKIGVPDAILGKQGPLTEAEKLRMQTHARYGAAILSHSRRPLIQAAAIVAGQHHEHWDGSGYPEGLAGEEIHIFGRIVGLADAYDALGNERCYRSAWEHDRVLEYIRSERGRKFDPRLVDLLLADTRHFQAIGRRYPDRENG